MNERVSPSELLPESGWMPVSEIPPVGYWIGFQYKGNFTNRLLVNVPALESICRSGDLPPVIITSDIWNPPAAATPEQVAPGLSALKKVSFRRNPNLPESETNDYRLMGFPESLSVFDDEDIPVGWTLRIKDRKLIYDFEQSHPRSEAVVAEHNFIHDIDKVVRQGLCDIALREDFGQRLTDHYDRAFHTAINAFQQFVASLPVSSMMSYDSIAAFLSTWFLSNSYYQELLHGLPLLAERGMIWHSQKHGHFMGRLGNSQHNRITYAWRRENFPEEYIRDSIPDYIPGRIVTAIVPGALLVRNFIATNIALLKYQQPFFRLSPKK